MAKKKSRSRKRGFSLPSAATLGQVGATGLFLLNRQNAYGRPIHEALAQKNMKNAALGLMTNAQAMITTADGWMQVLLPVVGIQLLKKALPRVRVNLFGINWSII